MSASDPPIRVLVVGGSSRAALQFRRLSATNPSFSLKTLVRNRIQSYAGEKIVETKDYFDPPDTVLENTDTLINFVGITRGRRDDAYWSVNVDGAINLANRAKRVGVSHFVQLSSLHVYGYAEDISLNTPEDPETAYARSKLAADKALLKLASEEFRVTVMRLPIIYGQGLGENLRRLAHAVTKLGWFPVTGTQNPRSVLHDYNLALALAAVVRKRLDGIRFAADPESFDIRVLAEVVADQIQRPVRLVRFPQYALFPLRLVSKARYFRLYKRNLIRADQCVTLGHSYVTLRAGLQDMLQQRSPNGH